jgi:hypothetical protein
MFYENKTKNSVSYIGNFSIQKIIKETHPFKASVSVSHAI